MPSVTTEQTVEVSITSSLKKKLQTKLRAFGANKSAIDTLLHAQTKLKDEMERLFIDAGEFNALQSGVKMDGYSVRHISPVTARFDKKKAIQRGYLTVAQIEECSQSVPGKAYVKINVPGDGGDSDVE